MIRTAIINTKTGTVENVVEYEAVPNGAPPGFPANYIAVASDAVEIGWSWDGSSLIAPPAPVLVPTPAQRLAATIAAGVAVASLSAPALNGTYAIDKAALANVSGIAAGIAARNRLPGGGATFAYLDAAGAEHLFTAAQFLDFASAVEDYVYALSRGQAAAQPLSIA